MATAVECEDFMDAVAEGDDSINTVVEDEDLIAAMGVRKNTTIIIMSTSPHQDQTSQTARVLRALGYEFNCFFSPLLKAPHIFSSTAITPG